MAANEAASLLKLIVGVDYGTTYSGLAYATSNANGIDSVKVIESWPGAGVNEFKHKTPSKIAYAEHNAQSKGFPSTRDSEGRKIPRDAWGHEVKGGWTSYSWTKLLLDKHTEPTRHDDPGLHDELANIHEGALQLPPDKTAEELIGDYLGHLYKHCMEELGRKYIREVLNITPIEFWFTHPAIWSDLAKNATLNAAKSAGFGSRPRLDALNLIPEPEAAAIAALRSADDKLYGVKDGDGVLVVDCGGGTVDLTTYKVKAVKPQITVHEAVSGDGGKCGSTTVDRNLVKLIEERFGDAFTSLPKEKIGPGSQFMASLEAAKCGWQGLNEDDGIEARCFLVMPTLERSDVDERYYDFESYEIVISWSDFKSCFDPVVTQILDLVKYQVDQAARREPSVKIVVLVGGFGSSLYLWNHLKEWCLANGDLDIITTKEPWSAIAKGAALRGLDGALVKKKICRRSYGITVSDVWKEGRDQIGEGERWPGRNEYMVKDCMDWAFYKGSEFVPGESHRFSFNIHISPRKLEKKQTELDIYQCQLDEAPERLNSNVKKLGQVLISLEDIDWSKVRTGSGPRGTKYTLNLKYDLIPESEQGKFDVRVLYINKFDEEKVCGSARMEFRSV